MDMMMTVMHTDAFPVEKVWFGGWGGELGWSHSCELRTVTQAAFLLGESKRAEPASRLVSGSTDFFDVTIKQMLDTFKS